jgi:hypothetical protein
LRVGEIAWNIGIAPSIGGELQRVSVSFTVEPALPLPRPWEEHPQGFADLHWFAGAIVHPSE